MAVRRECPLCRAPFLAQVSQLSTNFVLSALIQERFPKAYEERKRDAETDGEVLPSDGLTLPVAFIAARFLAPDATEPGGGAEQVFPPGLPVRLKLFEPRYLALVDRVMHTTSRQFAVQPARESDLGAIVRVEHAKHFPDGTVGVECIAECLYDVKDGAGVEEIDHSGGLCLVQCVPRVAMLPAVRGSAPYSDKVMNNHNRLRRCAERLLASAGTAESLFLHREFGHPPLQVEALTYYLAAMLYLPMSLRRQVMREPTVEVRQDLLIEFLSSPTREGSGEDPLEAAKPSDVLWVVATQQRGIGGLILGGQQGSGPVTAAVLLAILLVLVVVWSNPHDLRGEHW
jgi:hypothetical protein